MASRRLLSLLVVIGIALRAVNYFGNSSLWLDEILLSRNIIELPMRELLFAPLGLDQVAPRGFLFVEKLAVLANLTALVLYVLCAISAWVLRRRGVRLEQEPFVTPGGPLVPALTCAGLAWLFYETVTRTHLVAGGIALAVLLALYFVRTLRR